MTTSYLCRERYHSFLKFTTKEDKRVNYAEDGGRPKRFHHQTTTKEYQTTCRKLQVSSLIKWALLVYKLMQYLDPLSG